MAIKQVRIKDVKPNPFRDMTKYPINKEKIKELKASINRTDFWENIVGRKNGAGAEIAYGHHRLMALEELYKPTEKVGIIIRDLDDETMLHMMVDENLSEWQSDAVVTLETVASVVRAYADGKIKLVKVSAAPERCRYAPHFHLGKPESVTAVERLRKYTAETIQKFLGWKDDTKIQWALQGLHFIERGFLSYNHFKGLGNTAARKLIEETSKTNRGFSTEAKRAVKTGKVTQKKAEKTIRENVRKVANAVNTEIRKEGGTKNASVVGASARKNIRDTGGQTTKKLRDIEDFTNSLIRSIERTLTADDNLYKKLKAVVSNSDYISHRSRSKLVTRLRALSKRASDFADKLES
jgi:hypothetical protein